MRYLTAHSSAEYQTGFLATIGMALAPEGGFVEAWEHPDVGYSYRAGNDHGVQAGLGSYTMPFDLCAHCDYDFSYLHAGIITQGSSHSVIDDHEVIDATPSSFVCVERGRGSTVRWHGGQVVRGVELSIHLPYLEERILPFLGLGNSWLEMLGEDRPVTDLPRQVGAPLRHLESLLETGKLTHASLEAIACTLVATLEAACTDGQINPAQPPASVRVPLGSRTIALSADDIRKVERARSLIQEEAASFPTPSELARRLSIGEQKLKAGFAYHYSQTIWDCGNAERMSRAERLLRDSDMRVVEIAQAVGYKSTASFIEMFRNWSGATPHKYRMRIKGAEDRTD